MAYGYYVCSDLAVTDEMSDEVLKLIIDLAIVAAERNDAPTDLYLKSIDLIIANLTDKSSEITFRGIIHFRYLRIFDANTRDRLIRAATEIIAMERVNQYFSKKELTMLIEVEDALDELEDTFADKLALLKSR